MKTGSTLFLKIVIFLIGSAAAAFCVFAFPVMLRSENAEFRPIFLIIYLSFIAFFFALYQAFKLLNYIDAEKSFSHLSVKALRNIKYSAVSFGALYALGSPYIYYLAEIDDAPGMLAVALVFIGASVVVATFAAVLQKLIQNGLDLKSENDLTV